MKTIPERIEEFKKIQEDTLGFERYKIRRAKENLFFVDVYTRSGLIIKTKMTYITERELIDFVNEKTRELEKEFMPLSQ